MGRLSSGLLTRLQSSDGPFGWLLTVSAPTVVRMSDAPYSSLAIGHFEARVLSWSAIDYQVSNHDGAPAIVGLQVTFADTDRLWARLVEGADGDDIEGCAVTLHLAHPELADSEWEPIFTGIVKSWSFPSAMVVTLTCQTDDLALTRGLPVPGLKIDRTVWTNAAANALNLYAPILYGSWSSADYASQGAVPLQCVDTVADKWLVCAGRAKAVNAVYINGTAAGSWSASYVEKSGRVYTIVTFSGSPPADDDDVTADVDGYEDVGDGTGTLITAPTDQIAHFLTQWVFGDYKTGNWSATSSRIDATTLAAVRTYCSARGYTGAGRVADETDGYAELTSWLQSFELKAWWTPDGTLAFGVEDPTETDVYPGTVDSFHAAAFEAPRDADERVTTIVVSYVQSEVEGRTLRSISAADQTATSPRELAIEQRWGVAS